MGSVVRIHYSAPETFESRVRGTCRQSEDALVSCAGKLSYPVVSGNLKDDTNMVAVVQLVERQIVTLVVACSNHVSHPISDIYNLFSYIKGLINQKVN